MAEKGGQWAANASRVHGVIERSVRKETLKLVRHSILDRYPAGSPHKGRSSMRPNLVRTTTSAG